MNCSESEALYLNCFFLFIISVNPLSTQSSSIFKNRPMSVRQKSVENLIRLLQSDKDLKNAVEISLQKAQQPGIETLEAFYDFLDAILTHIPTENELMPSV